MQKIVESQELICSYRRQFCGCIHLVFLNACLNFTADGVVTFTKGKIEKKKRSDQHYKKHFNPFFCFMGLFSLILAVFSVVMILASRQLGPELN